MLNGNGSLNVVVVGTGMYVIGRGTDGYGTIMPALYEWKRNRNLGDVCLAGRSKKGIGLAKRKIKELENSINMKASIRYFPKKKQTDPNSYRQAFRVITKPAACIIAVPDALHKDIAQAAMREGLHTLVVKPLCPTLGDVNDLIALQDKTGVYCAVEFHKRFDAANLKLRDAISAGAIGDPLYFIVEYSQRKSIPSKQFRKWVTTTNIFQYLGIHYVDIIYFATGARPKRAMAVGQKGWLASKRINTYDSIQGIIEWEMASGKKFTSHILTNWIDPEETSAMSDQKIKVIGTHGRFESDQKKRGITIVTDEKGIEEPNPYFCARYGNKGSVSYKGYGIESVCQFLDDVVQVESGSVSIEELESKRATFKQSIVPTAVLEAVNKSLKGKGKWVRVV